MALKSLDAVTSDTSGSVLSSSDVLKYPCVLQYIATIPSGSATIYLEGSLDGTNFSLLQSAVVNANAIAFLNVSNVPVLHIRARVSGLASGRTVTAWVAMAGEA